MPPTLLSGDPLPHIIYGTARREGKQPPDILTALRTGYRAIDTASSRRFHVEHHDGEALSEYIAESGVSRRQILVQSKYGPPNQQSDPWPYDIVDGNTERVFKSVLRSAADLRVDVIDVYFLHTPLGCIVETLLAWQALESIVDHGGIRYLGIANVNISILRRLCESTRVKPKFVQNWFRKANDYDREVVAFCREAGIVYQIFGVFDESNTSVLMSAPVQRRAADQSVSLHQALLQMLLGGAAIMGLQLCILDGTTNHMHMAENLNAVTQLDTLNRLDVGSFLELIYWL